MTNVNIPNQSDRTVWDDLWNPPVDEWDPHATPVETDTIGEPSHGDEPDAEPVSESYGQAASGTTPDVRANLLTEVRQAGQTPAPVQEVHHVVETSEIGTPIIRARTMRVVGNIVPTTLLEENENRRRALLKIVTTASTVIIGPARQGGNPQFTAAPTGPANWWYQATGDPILEVKSQGAVEAYGTTVGGAVDVCIWEELEAKDGPGVGI